MNNEIESWLKLLHPDTTIKQVSNIVYISKDGKFVAQYDINYLKYLQETNQLK